MTGLTSSVTLAPESQAAPAPDALDLAALLCSRVCHDLISPVGAIVNGLEVLDDAKNADDRDFALDLIRKSARNASAKLQFCRLAFGAAGSAGAQIDTGDAEAMTRGFLEDGKTKVIWNLPRTLQPKNRVKLLLNMLVIAQQTIPRGGTLTVEALGAGEEAGFRVHAEHRRPALRRASGNGRCACGAALLHAAARPGLQSARGTGDGRRSRCGRRVVSLAV
jgi:histidine phosphotransferase ChpT